MSDVTVKATRSFGAMVKDEFYSVEKEGERIGHLIEAGYLKVVGFVGDHGDQVDAGLKDVAEAVPAVAPEAAEAETIVEAATTVAKDLEGKK